MIFETVFTYEAMVLLARKRNATPRTYMASYPVEIRELADEDAPVALRYVSREMGKPKDVDLRWFDGTLWECHPPGHDGDVHVGTLEWLTKASATPGGKGIIRNRDDDGTAKAIEDDPDVKEIVDVSDREDKELFVRNYGQRMIAVDGRLWERTTEPLLNATHYHSKGKVCVEVVQVEMPRRAELFFRMDHAHRIEALLGIEDAVVELPDVQVLIPDAVRSRIDEHGMVMHGKHALGVMKDYVIERDVAFFAAFAGLRDIQDENKRKVLDPDWDMRPYVEVLTEALDAAQVYADGWSDWIEDARASVKRWEGAEKVDFGWTHTI